MKDLLYYIVTNLVNNKEAVSIEEQSEEGVVDLLLTIDPKEMGLIIGKNGTTIRAIRKLLTVRAIAENVRVNLQLVEPQGQSTNSEEKVGENSEELKENVEIESKESAEESKEVTSTEGDK